MNRWLTQHLVALRDALRRLVASPLNTILSLVVIGTALAPRSRDERGLSQSTENAILLAGGPSLDSSIPWIQAHQDDCIIIAVSRISRRLLNADITPDFIFSVDPQGLSLDVSREMFHFDGKSVFIHSYHAFPAMVAQWLGTKAYLGPLFPWPSPLNGVDRTSGGATVTNIAWACALEMGFAEIVLCGVDLCYSSEGHTHASFSKDRDHGPRFEGETRIETNAGAYAETTHAYAFAAQHIQHLAELFNIFL